mgnify:CR=1 FL=1
MLVHPQFDPIAVQVGPLAVHWYGLMYLIGFTLFYLLGLAARNGEESPRQILKIYSLSVWSA